jgi:hypothetical protein
LADTTLAFEILAKDKASKVFDRAAESAAEMGEKVSRSSAGLTRMGDGADNAETRIVGLKDSVDGVSTILAGPGEQGIAAYLQGWADFASGIANFAVPAFQKLLAGGAAQVKQAAITTASTASAVGAQVAQWVLLGVQSTIQAAKVAAAWLISIGPIAIVGAAVAGLVFLFVKHWDTIKDAVGAAAEWVKDRITGMIDFFKRIPGWIAGAARNLADLITRPYKTAFNSIARLWNNTVGKLSFKVPSWVPGIGGKGFDVPDIPTFHRGGEITAALPRFPGDRIDERTIRARVGETVLTGAESRERAAREQHLHLHAAEFTLGQAIEAGKRYGAAWASMAEVR